MTQITPAELDISGDDSTLFRPLRGGRNPHLQTMLPRVIRRKLGFTPVWQRLELPDGDFVDLAWSEDPNEAKHKPRLVVFHGLEGSLHSPYAHGLIEAARERGWLGVVMHFRGCSGEPNRLNRIYHSGETEDGTWFLHWLKREFGDVRTAAVGYSLGGNMLACLLAKEGHAVPLDAAVIVSAPFVLEACSAHIEKGFSRVYQHYLLNLLKANASRKLKAYPGTLPIDLLQLKRVRRLREFDDLITARIHGFADAIDYYRQCSAMPLLNKIACPTLIIHAKDDPFMDHHVIPDPATLPSCVEYQLTEHGGHVGFVGGTLLRPEMWLEKRIPDWLNTWLED
jgi:predicted alpha/beta-fold hydrolase